MFIEHPQHGPSSQQEGAAVRFSTPLLLFRGFAHAWVRSCAVPTPYCSLLQGLQGKAKYRQGLVLVGTGLLALLHLQRDGRSDTSEVGLGLPSLSFPPR